MHFLLPYFHVLMTVIRLLMIDTSLELLEQT